MPTTLDLHAHSEASEDSRAPVEAYLNWIKMRHAQIPIDGVVLTEHRQWDPSRDYRALEDKFGVMVLRAAEVETDYGHVLVFGVNDDIARRFDFTNVHLPAQEVINEVARMGGIAVPCHPGRPNIGLYEHYQRKPALENVIAAELLNGGSRKGENERSAELIEKYRYKATGGSDSHLVSLIGLCATRFDAEIRDVEKLVQELKTGNYQAVDFRPKRNPVPRAIPAQASE